MRDQPCTSVCRPSPLVGTAGPRCVGQGLVRDAHGQGRTAGEVFRDCFEQTGEWDVMRRLEIVLKVCDTMA